MRRSELSSTLHSSHLSTWKNAYLAFTLMEIRRPLRQISNAWKGKTQDVAPECNYRGCYAASTPRTHESTLVYLRGRTLLHIRARLRERVMQGKWIVTRNWRAGSITAFRVVRRKASYAALVSLFFRHVIERPDKTISFRGEQSVPSPFRLRAFIMFHSLISRKGSIP